MDDLRIPVLFPSVTAVLNISLFHLFFFTKAWYGRFDLLPGSLAGMLCSVMQEEWI